YSNLEVDKRRDNPILVLIKLLLGNLNLAWFIFAQQLERRKFIAAEIQGRIIQPLFVDKLFGKFFRFRSFLDGEHRIGRSLLFGRNRFIDFKIDALVGRRHLFYWYLNFNLCFRVRFWPGLRFTRWSYIRSWLSFRCLRHNFRPVVPLISIT